MSTAEVPPLRGAQPDPGPLEARLDLLGEALRRLETRIALLESGTALQPSRRDHLAETALAAAPLPSEVLPSSTGLLGLLGRVCLILGGATLIRALVDAGTLPHGWGVGLGLAYALVWILLADRVKATLDAAFLGLASVLIAYPLLVEATARFGILSPDLAAGLLLAVALLHGAVAWRRNLQPLLWTATLAALGAALVLMAACRTIEPFLAVFLVLGGSSLWLTYGRRWHGLRWPTALAADLGVLILTALATWPGGVPEAYRGITPGRTLLFALALPLLYVGSFAMRMLHRRRVINAFEVVQTVLVLLVGLGGALRVALASGSGVGLLGAGVCLAGLGCYATALPFAEDQEETRANFHFFTFLALVLLLLGGPILLPLAAFAPLAGLLGLGLLVAGLRLGRAVLLLQACLSLGAGALTSGLITWSFRAFLGPVGPTQPLGFAGLLALAMLAGALALILRRRPADALLARVRPLLLLLGATTALGLGALGIRTILMALRAGGDAGLLAAVRTGVLACLVLLLAWAGRRRPTLQLRWLVYPLLVVSALKFLFEDLAVGRPLTLFLGFMCFGATLILAPRLLKAALPPDSPGNPNPSLPEVHP